MTLREWLDREAAALEELYATDDLDVLDPALLRRLAAAAGGLAGVVEVIRIMYGPGAEPEPEGGAR